MTAWPTQTAIHAAAHGASARAAERRARLDAIDAAAAFTVRILILPSHKGRFSLSAFTNTFDAKVRAAHLAVGA